MVDPAPRHAHLSRRIDGVVALVALAAGVVAALGPTSPTGNAAVDAVLVGGGVAATVFVGASARWWTVAVLAGAALSIAIAPGLMVLGAVALAGALWAGSRDRPHPELLAVAIGLALNVLARAELTGFLGLSTLITLAAVGLVFFSGLRRQPRGVRRATWVVAGAGVLLAVVAAAGFASAVFQSRSELTSGVRWAEEAVAQLEDGEFDEAATSFAEAAEDLEAAHEHLSSPLAAPAAAVPVLAQHREAAVEMSGVGGRGAATVAEAMDDIDLDALRLVDGRIDLAALESLREPLERTRRAMDELAVATDESLRSPWLIGRAVRELRDFETSVAEHVPSLDNAVAVLDVAPQMLGADGPRTYLVLFTTPAEARGIGGFVGSYAELTVDDGQLTLSQFGRAQDLDAAIAAADIRLDGPAEFLERYGRFGFGGGEGGDGLVGDATFRNVGMTPNFPWVGAIAADLYEQASGRTIDGVIAMDPWVLAQLLDYTGSVPLASYDVELGARNAVDYLLRDQYVLGADDDELRADALAEAADLTFAAVLDGSLPDPVTLARDLGPLSGDRRLMVWSANPDEEALLDRVGLGGAIPALDGADGWSVTVTNAGGNKIDSFLERAASYEATTDPATGETSAVLRVRLTNTAPADGLPRYVIGNEVGLPRGTSRLYVSFYSALGLDALTVDGAPSGVEVGTEGGWNVYSRYVDLPPGGSAEFELDLRGVLEHPDELVTWTQPLANPMDDLE